MKKMIISILLAFGLAGGLVAGPAFVPAAPVESASAVMYGYAPGWSGTQTYKSGDSWGIQVNRRYAGGSTAWTGRFGFTEHRRVVFNWQGQYRLESRDVWVPKK